MAQCIELHMCTCEALFSKGFFFFFHKKIKEYFLFLSRNEDGFAGYVIWRLMTKNES